MVFKKKGKKNEEDNRVRFTEEVEEEVENYDSEPIKKKSHIETQFVTPEQFLHARLNIIEDALRAIIDNQKLVEDKVEFLIKKVEEEE